MPDQVDASATAIEIETTHAAGPLIATGASITRSSVNAVAAAEQLHSSQYSVRPDARPSDARAATTVNPRNTSVKAVTCATADTAHPVSRLVNDSATTPARPIRSDAAVP